MFLSILLICFTFLLHATYSFYPYFNFNIFLQAICGLSRFLHLTRRVLFIVLVLISTISSLDNDIFRLKPKLEFKPHNETISDSSKSALTWNVTSEQLDVMFKYDDYQQHQYSILKGMTDYQVLNISLLTYL